MGSDGSKQPKGWSEGAVGRGLGKSGGTILWIWRIDMMIVDM